MIRKIEMKFMRNIQMKRLLGTLIVCFVTSTMAATTSIRDASNYYLGGGSSGATHLIHTYPKQPNQPVYAWRTHTNFDGTSGIHSQNGDFIGYTDHNGVLAIILYSGLPNDPIHCGWISSERVAVGSTSAPKSNALSFTITAPRIGPLPPWFNQCQIPRNGNLR